MWAETPPWFIGPACWWPCHHEVHNPYLPRFSITTSPIGVPSSNLRTLCHPTRREPWWQHLSMTSRGVTTKPLQRLTAITSIATAKAHCCHFLCHCNTSKELSCITSSVSKDWLRHFQCVQWLGHIQSKIRCLTSCCTAPVGSPCSGALEVRRKRLPIYAAKLHSFWSIKLEELVVEIIHILVGASHLMH